MAKPNGALEPSDFGYTVTAQDAGSATREYVYALHNLPMMPQHWTTNNEIHRHKVRLDWVIYTSTSGQVNMVWQWGGQQSAYNIIYSGSTSTLSWSAGDLPVQPTVYPEGEAVPNLNLSPFGPRYLPHEFTLWRENSGSVIVGALLFTTRNDEAYDGEYWEKFEKTTVANMPHNERRPASSWLVSHLCEHNTNNLTYEARMVFALPLFN